jgi:hypothetical protein
MARITVKSRNRFKLDLNEKEMNTLTIALALLDIPTMEQELKEQFKTLTDVTGLYPQVQLKSEHGNLTANSNGLMLEGATVQLKEDEKA